MYQFSCLFIYAFTSAFAFVLFPVCILQCNTCTRCSYKLVYICSTWAGERCRKYHIVKNSYYSTVINAYIYLKYYFGAFNDNVTYL